MLYENAHIWTMISGRDAFVVDINTIMVVDFTYKLANYSEYQDYL